MWQFCHIISSFFWVRLSTEPNKIRASTPGQVLGSGFQFFPIPACNNPHTLCTLSTVGIPSTATANICRRRKTKIVGFFLSINTIAIIDLNFGSIFMFLTPLAEVTP